MKNPNKITDANKVQIIRVGDIIQTTHSGGTVEVIDFQPRKLYADDYHLNGIGTGIFRRDTEFQPYVVWEYVIANNDCEQRCFDGIVFQSGTYCEQLDDAEEVFEERKY